MASITLRPRDKNDDNDDQKNDKMDTDDSQDNKSGEPMKIDQGESNPTAQEQAPQPTPQVEVPVTPDAEELRRRRLGRFNTMTTSPTTISSSPPTIQLPNTTTTTVVTPTKPSNALAASLLASSPSAAPSNPFGNNPNNPSTPASNTPQLLTHPQNLTPNNNRSAPISIGGRRDAMDVEPKSSPGQWPLTPQSPLGFSPSTPSGTNQMQRTPAPGTTPPSNSNLGTSPPRTPVNFQDWAPGAVRQILTVSLSPTPNKALIYLESLARSMNYDDRSIDAQPREIVDQILMTILTMDELPNKMSVLQYLIRSFNTVCEEKKRSSIATDPKKMEFLDFMGKLVGSYIGLLVQMPDNFGHWTTERVVKEFVTMLVSDVNGTSVTVDLLNYLAERFSFDELKLMFEPIFEEVSTLLRASNLLENFLPYYRAFALLIKNKTLVQVLVSLDNWIPMRRKTGKEMEVNSILGSFFRPSSFPDSPTIGAKYFPPESTKSQSAEQATLVDIRTRLHSAQRGAYEIVMTLLKSSKEGRERMLDWFAAVIERNKERGKMQMDTLVIASDGFMLNVSAVLLNLAEPFMDPYGPKVSTIDIDYFTKTKRLTINDETRLALNLEETKEGTKRRLAELQNQMTDVENPINFITECFYFGIRSLHFGMLRALPRYENQVRKLNEHRQAVKNLNESRAQWMMTPAAEENEAALLEITAKLEKITQYKLCFQAHLVDQALISNTVRFYNLLAIWLVKNAAGVHDNALNDLKLPLPSPAPLPFAMLPEHFVEDIAEFFQFANQFIPDFMENVPLDDMMTFITVFMSSPPYVKNPYMRAKLVDILVGLTPKNFGKVLRYNIFERNPLAQKYLTPALMQFYVEVEHTGASTQFYDKFNVRYSISLVMKYLWKFPMHREAFKREAQNKQSFLGFVNMLINDSIYLLDESLAKLAKIRSTQLEMSSPDWATRYNPNERAELEQEHVRSERIVRTYLLLAHETMRMFHYLARDCASYFFNNTDLPERVASLLNYFLVQLVGPKCAELKVRNPEKYNFDPKWLLRKIVAIYLHFSTQEQFAAAVASDARSYNHEVFKKTTSILQRERLLGEDVIGKFQHFIDEVQQQAQRESFIEDQLGDIPNEFLDPIMSTLMRDPVILPSSKVTVDRKTITRHLLSDQNDPFNRSHLTVDMLQSDVELKNKIDQFIADRIKQK